MRTAATACVVLLFLTACSGPGGSRPAAPQAAVPQQARPAPPAPTFQGGNAIRRGEVPYEQLLAEARSTGRPAVLFFWTSW